MMQLNRLLLFCFIAILLVIPILLILLLKGNDIFKGNQKFKNLLKLLCKDLSIFYLIGIMVMFTIGPLKQNICFYLGHLIALLVIILEFFILNYFTTSSKNLKYNFEVFIESILNFNKEYFLFHLGALLVILYTSSLNSNIFYAVLGAYIFLILIKITEYYDTKKKKVEKRALYAQIILNIGCLYYLHYISKFLYFFIQKSIVMRLDIANLLCTILILLITVFVMQKIEVICKILKNILGKKS